MTTRQPVNVGWNSDELAAPGTYCLILRLEKAARIRIGALCGVPFPAGWYAYVGSALGSGGLKARLSHHVRRTGRCHWHIDYLRQRAVVEGAFVTLADVSYEHRWALRVSRTPEATIPARGFGASDCRCPAHLFHFKHRSLIGTLERFLVAQIPPKQLLTFLHYRKNCS